MASSMYMGQPLHGQKPKIAIDLYDSSLTNIAPSYLTSKLNEKIMNDLTDKSGTTAISNDGRDIAVYYDDGTKETLTTSEDGQTYTNCVYNKNGILLKKTVTTIDSVTGNIRADVAYDGSVNGVVDFENASWEEIAVMLTRHYSGTINLADFWSVGDTKLITYNGMEANGVGESHKSASQKIVILDFDHDTISGGTKSAITLGFLNGLGNPGYMHSENSNVGGWASCNRRTWCNNTFYNALPAGLRSLIKTVDKFYTPGNGSRNIMTCTDKCFLLSESEIKGAATSNSLSTEGEQYPIFVSGDAVKKKQGDDVAGYDNWLTRSACIENETQYVYIESDGDVNVSDANSQYQIIPAFCI
jgi:hypothetical protein